MIRKKSKVEIISSVVAVALVLGLLLFVGNIISKTLFGTKGTNEQSKTDTKTKSSYRSPIVISGLDEPDTAEEFVKKYEGEWVQFDGIIHSTLKDQSDLYPHAVLYLDDQSLMPLEIDAIESSFDASLQQFTTVDYRADPTVAVRVVARVSKYNERSMSVQLQMRPNVDGSTPSVTRR